MSIMRRNKVPPCTAPHMRNFIAKHADGFFDILLNSVIKDGTSKERMQLQEH